MNTEILYASKFGQGNRHEHIVAIGNNARSWTVADAVVLIDGGSMSFHVKAAGGLVAIRTARGPSGVRYVHAEADGVMSDSLLHLPPCTVSY